MLLAVAGTVCLFLVVGTSIRAARRRLRYESWHLMHLYAYLGVGLALPHQLWTGQELVSSTGAKHLLVDGVGVGGRRGRGVAAGDCPLARNLRHQLRVTSVVSEAPGVVSVYLTGRRLEKLRVEAGQFMSFRFLGRPGWTRANPYSLSAAPDGRSLRLTAAAVGDGSAALATLVPGTRAYVRGSARPSRVPRAARVARSP